MCITAGDKIIASFPAVQRSVPSKHDDKHCVTAANTYSFCVIIFAASYKDTNTS